MEFIGLKEVNEELYIVVEFMNNGDLLSYIRNQENPVRENQLLEMAFQIANGMAYLEEQKIIHKSVLKIKKKNSIFFPNSY